MREATNNSLDRVPLRAARLLAALFLVSQVAILVPPACSVNPGRVSLGFPHIPTDHVQYQAFSVQTRDEGRLLTRNPYTTEPQEGRFLLVGLAAAGVLAKWLPDAVAWHALRLIGLALLAWVLWGMASRLFPGRRAVVAFAALLFTGGLQWAVRIGVGVGAWEAPGLNSWLENPWNFSLFWTGAISQWVLPLTVLIAALLLEMDQDPPGIQALPRGLLRAAAFALLWFLHPYTAMAYGALLAAFVVVPQRSPEPWAARVRRAAWGALPVLVAAAAVLAYVVWATEDPVYASSSAQTRLWKLAYPLWLAPLVYGPQILLALAGLGPDREHESGFVRVQVWLAVVALLSLNTVVTGAKFQYLVFVPLVLLEVRGLYRLLDRCPTLAGRLRPWIIAAVLGLASADSVAGIVRDFRDESTRAASEADPAALAAIEALRGLPDGGVLCEPSVGLLVPWKAGKTVFVGHWFLSTRFAEKADLVRWFLGGSPGSEPRLEFLRNAHIRYVLRGPHREGPDPLVGVPGLVVRWSKSGWEIYEFVEQEAAD